MSCDSNKNRKAQNKDAVNTAKASLDEATAALAEATKQEKDTEKKHVDAEAGFIMFIVSSAASGLVSRCRIPTAAVAQRGLFRILLGSSGVTDTVAKAAFAPPEGIFPVPHWSAVTDREEDGLNRSDFWGTTRPYNTFGVLTLTLLKQYNACTRVLVPVFLDMPRGNSIVGCPLTKII